MSRPRKKLEQNLKQIFARQENEPGEENKDKSAGSPLGFLSQKPVEPSEAGEEKPEIEKTEESKPQEKGAPEPATPAAVTAQAATPVQAVPSGQVEQPDVQPAPAPAATVEKTETKPSAPATRQQTAVQPVEDDRALAMLGEKQAGEVDDTLRQVLVFRLGEGFYGVSVFRVQTIIKPQPVYPVPRTEAFITGLINLRGEVVPTIDLRARLGLQVQEQDAHTRFVVIEYGEYLASMVVDEVVGVENIPEDHFQKPAGVVMGVDTRYLDEIARAGDRLVLILNLSELIVHKEVKE